MNIPLLRVLWQHIMYLCVRCFQCREVCGLQSTYLPALETTHTQRHVMLPQHS